MTSASADAGNVTKTAHKVVVNPVLTPGEPFNGRSLIKYGVGESVKLSFTTSPSGYEGKIGTPSWSADSQVGAGSIAPPMGGSAIFTAGDVQESVVLTLSILDGPLKGKKYPNGLSIIAPSGVRLVKTSGVIHQKGYATAGFLAATYLVPTEVSFSQVQEEEEYSAAEEKAGKQGPVGVGTGSLSFQNGTLHNSGQWNSVGSGDINLGCRVLQADHITAENFEGPFTEDGDFTWTIPRDYRVGAAGRIHSAYTSVVHHVHQSKTDTSGNSTTTIEKGGIPPVSAKQNDPSSGLDL